MDSKPDVWQSVFIGEQKRGLLLLPTGPVLWLGIEEAPTAKKEYVHKGGKETGINKQPAGSGLMYTI